MAMTTDKLREALLACEHLISTDANEAGITMAIRAPAADTPTRRTSHLLWMTRQSLQLIEDGNTEQALCWLGFLQGVLWSDNKLSIDKIETMNKGVWADRADKERV